MLSLCYLPTAGRLTITIIKGRSLKAMDITGKSGRNNGKFTKVNVRGHAFQILTLKSICFVKENGSKRKRLQSRKIRFRRFITKR